MTKARRIRLTLISVALLTVAVVAYGVFIRGRRSSVNWLSRWGDAELSQAQRGLAAGSDPNAASPGEHTSLIAAINVQRPDLVRALLNAGANPNLPSLGGQTPLLAAVTHPSDEIVEIILDADANPDGKDGGETRR
jgi:ankyrin repeat protein